MSIVDDLNKINNIKNDIKQAIRDKGVEMEDNTPFAQYPDCIRNIETGGGNPVYEILYNIRTNNGTYYGSLFTDYQGTELNLNSLDTSNVTDMSYTFLNCNKLQTLNIDAWNTSNVTRMSNTFSCCTSLTSLDLSNFITSNVTSMNSMFNQCNNLQTLDIRNWDTSSIEGNYNIDEFLGFCDNLRELRLDNCNNDTISMIIRSMGFPANDIGITRTIYCKESEATELTAPNGWVFSYVD